MAVVAALWRSRVGDARTAPLRVKPAMRPLNGVGLVLQPASVWPPSPLPPQRLLHGQANQPSPPRSVFNSTRTASPLTALVTRKTLTATFRGKVLSIRDKGQFACTFKVIDGNLYRGVKCKPTRPNWQLITGMLVGAVARASVGRPLPNVELRPHQGASALPAGMPVLGWCAKEPGVLVLPSPYEADCVYHHRYVFTLEHHRRMLAEGLAMPPEAFPWASRIPKAVWRGTCTGRGLERTRRLQIISHSRKSPELIDAALFPCGVCASLLRTDPHLFGNESQGLVQPDYARYKYVLDLDGDGCSGRLAKLMSTGAVVLKPWSAGYPFYYRGED